MKAANQPDIASLASGSDRAWNIFLDQHEDSFLRTAWTKCGNWDAAREAVQDALLEAIKRLSTGVFDKSGVEHLKNYIFFLLKTRDVVSRGSRRLAGKEEFDADRIATIDPGIDLLVLADDVERIRQAMTETLTEREQVVVKPLFFRTDPLSNREIAAEFNIPYGTVCSDRSRAINKLRHRLGTAV